MATLVLPCLNEVQALQWIAKRVPPDMDMLVADNGSSDGSQEVARDLGAQVIEVPQRGYGAAVHAGVTAARPGLVAVMDADATFDPTDLAPLLEAVRAGVDLAACVRQPVSTAAMPWQSRAGNAYLSWRLRHKTGLAIHDIGPVRVFNRDPYLALGIQDRAFGYPMEVFVRAAQAGWTFSELPMPYRERIGKSKVTGSLMGSIRATRDLWRATP
ncbi:MAG: glycosyltransferase family 2 protein [Actinomycetia bacterium]|nr:glycosyltransferase family 2 protein [Actinomycetes bacterium]